MDRDAALDIHTTQDGAFKPVIDIARSVLRGAPPADPAAAIADAIATVAADAEEAGRKEQERDDERTYARVTGANGHDAVDLDRIRAATSPAALSVLLSEALVHGPDAARRAWNFIGTRLKEMAAAEQRTHRQPSATSAFHALVVWESRMRGLAAHTPARVSASDTTAARVKAIRERGLAIADAVGLRQAVEQAARRAALPAEPPSSIVAGRFFDLFPSVTKRR